MLEKPQVPWDGSFVDWVRSQVAGEGYWFQRMDLGPGLTTPGWSDPQAEKLPYFGLEPDASLVTLSKRLVCKECGSKAVQTFRYSADTPGPPLVPEN